MNGMAIGFLEITGMKMNREKEEQT